MSIELMQKLSTASYIAAGVFFLVSIALFFLLDIKRVIGDVTGATARKAIQNIREQNEASGDKAYKPSPVNAARGKLTDKISPSGRVEQQETGALGAPGTAKLDTTELSMEALQDMGAGETALLSTGNETTLLSGTNENSGQTTLLSAEELGVTEEAPVEQKDENFTVDVEMGFTGSSEIIE